MRINQDAYEFLVNRFPQSNRRASGLVRLASVHQSLGDLPNALSRFQQVVAEHPDVDFAPEAQLHVGNCYRDMGQFANAFDAYQFVEQRWPDSRFVPNAYLEAGFARMRQEAYEDAGQTFMTIVTRWPVSAVAADALQHANRALIHAELEAHEPEPGVVVPSEVDNSAGILANVQWVLSDYPDAPACANALLDVINYHAKRVALNIRPQSEAAQQIVELCETLQTVMPAARATARAKLDQATILLAQDPQRAWSLLNDAMAWAESEQDIELLNDAQFTTGQFFNQEQRLAEARAAWQELLAREQSPLFEGEVKLAIALTYLQEADHVSASAALADIAASDSYPPAVRASALVCRAQPLKRLNQREEAIAALNEAIALVPQTRTAETASRVRDIYERQRVP